jgi:hypothetical protein
MAITADELSTLREIFEDCDDEWLLDHISINSRKGREFSIHIDHANCQYIKELFGSEYVV